MSHFVVINKETLDKQIINSNKVTAQPGTIIHAKFVREDVLEFVQEGNHLIIKLKNGEVIQIENYFVVTEGEQKPDLVLEDSICNFVKFDFKDGVVSFEELTGLELLLPPASSSFLTALPWIAGGAAIVGGGIALADHDSSNHKHVPPKAPVITIDPVVPGLDGNTTINGTVDNPNADVTVTGQDGTKYPVIVDPIPNEDGTHNWTVDVPTANLPEAGKDVEVVGTVTDPETNLTSPEGENQKVVPEYPTVEVSYDPEDKTYSVDFSEVPYNPETQQPFTPEEIKDLLLK
ncbi:BapA prefix-like domain-containing protein, partial [Acinetobacter sp. 187]|uniref:BapA/Bap/LapF family prefix-like domain-containing protein n=1 Tax=Acinetobacter lanii TaxID=2715163 RepID=UPI00140E4229